MPNPLQTPRTTYLGPVGAPPGVKWLLIVNCGMFVLYFFASWAGYERSFADFELWPQAVLTLPPAVWQLVTYLFLHDPRGFSHILINMLILWMIGADLEQGWGTKRFLKYYFLCGIGAGISVVVVNALAGNNAPTIGASGAIFGLLLAFGVLYPDRIILFMFLFPMKAKYLVMIYGAVAFLGTFGMGGSGISHVAHLGGMVFGFLYLKGRRLNPLGAATDQYQSWKMRRLKRKFEVYRRHKNHEKHDPWVN